VKLLLDTHIWLWSRLEPGRLSRAVSLALANPTNELWLSPVSIWETLTLCEKGRLVLDEGAPLWIVEAMRARPMTEAPLTAEVALATASINLAHRDPADRFLVATAKVFELTLVTADDLLLRARQVPMLANR
jgi:PIN domain nuclease of toxin-antitoxin system